MNNICLTGSSGFLGSSFISQNFMRFKSILALNRTTNKKIDNISYEIVDLTKKTELLNILKNHNIDIIIHFAFDHSYNNNFKIIDSLIFVCKCLEIKLIHISSIGVLQIKDNRLIKKFNNFYDPYSYTKRVVEKKILKSEINFKIIYPTIVYGDGGNWTKFINKCINAKSFSIPRRGNVSCNFIHVTEFSKKLMKYVNLKKSPEKKIIGDTNANWIDLYNLHNQQKKNLNPQLTKYKYHDNIILNFIFFIWKNSICGLILNLILSIYKSGMKNKSNTQHNLENIFEHVSPIFMNRDIHNKPFNYTD